MLLASRAHDDDDDDDASTWLKNWKVVSRVDFGRAVMKGAAAFKAETKEWVLLCATYGGQMHQVRWKSEGAASVEEYATLPPYPGREVHVSAVHAMHIVPNTGWMLTSRDACTGLEVWNVAANNSDGPRPAPEFTLETARVSGCIATYAYSSGGRRQQHDAMMPSMLLATAAGDTVMLSNVGGCDAPLDEAVLLPMNGVVLSVCLAAAATQSAYSGNKVRLLAHTSNQLCVWEVVLVSSAVSAAPPTLVANPDNSTRMYACAALGRTRAFLGCEDGNCVVVDLDDVNDASTLFGHTKKVRSVQMTRDDARGISASWDGSVRVWDLARQCCLQSMAGLHSQYVTSVSLLSRDQSYVFTTSSDKTCAVVDMHWADRARLVHLLVLAETTRPLLLPHLPVDVLRIVKSLLFGSSSSCN